MRLQTPVVFCALQHPPVRTKEPPPLDETADKMDALMCLTFEHLQRQAAHGRLDETFETLLHSFQTTILHTYRSKFTQVRGTGKRVKAGKTGLKQNF